MRVWVFAFLLLPFICSGQAEQDLLKRYRFTVSPSAFVNTYPGLQLGVERRMFSEDYLELEIAYLFPVKNNFDYRTSGYRLKAGYKVQNLIPDLRTTFIFFFRKTQADRLEDFSRFDGLFFQQIPFVKSKTLVGFTIGLLKEIQMGKVNMQFGASGGPGRYLVRDQGIPENSEQFSGIPIFDLYEREGNYFFPIISVQWKIIF